jgi:hypothetical protein
MMLSAAIFPLVYPALEQPILQSTGLLLYLLALVWLRWVEPYLVRHFSTAPAALAVMVDGPYRFVWHPRSPDFLSFSTTRRRPPRNHFVNSLPIQITSKLGNHVGTLDSRGEVG